MAPFATFKTAQDLLTVMQTTLEQKNVLGIYVITADGERIILRMLMIRVSQLLVGYAGDNVVAKALWHGLVQFVKKVLEIIAAGSIAPHESAAARAGWMAFAKNVARVFDYIPVVPVSRASTKQNGATLIRAMDMIAH